MSSRKSPPSGEFDPANAALEALCAFVFTFSNILAGIYAKNVGDNEKLYIGLSTFFWIIALAGPTGRDCSPLYSFQGFLTRRISGTELIIHTLFQFTGVYVAFYALHNFQPTIFALCPFLSKNFGKHLRALTTVGAVANTGVQAAFRYEFVVCFAIVLLCAYSRRIVKFILPSDMGSQVYDICAWCWSAVMTLSAITFTGAMMNPNLAVVAIVYPNNMVGLLDSSLECVVYIAGALSGSLFATIVGEKSAASITEFLHTAVSDVMSPKKTAPAAEEEEPEETKEKPRGRSKTPAREKSTSATKRTPRADSKSAKSRGRSSTPKAAAKRSSTPKKAAASPAKRPSSPSPRRTRSTPKKKKD